MAERVRGAAITHRDWMAAGGARAVIREAMSDQKLIEEFGVWWPDRRYETGN